MVLISSYKLKKLPDLSNARNLEYLDLSYCESLVEIPSSIGNLQKLTWFRMGYCLKVQVLPTNFNLRSLSVLDMMGCSQLRKFPDVSRNLNALMVGDTMLKEVPESASSIFPHLEVLFIYGSANPWKDVPKKFINRVGPGIEKIPVWIKDLCEVKVLCIYGCPKLASLPELPGLLRTLAVDTCDSLETLPSFASESLIEDLFFCNCFRLSLEAERVIIEQSLKACLPGRKIPAEFDHRAIGNSLTIRSSYCLYFRICVLIAPSLADKYDDLDFKLWCRIRLNGCPIENKVERILNIQAEHLFIFTYVLFEYKDRLLEHDNEMLFEFSTISQFNIIECGVRILTDEILENRGGRNLYGLEQVKVKKQAAKHASCFDLNCFVRKHRSLGRRTRHI